MDQKKEKVLEIRDLKIAFKTDSGIVHAVRGVSFDLYKGETLCIVGESGSGKSVTSKAIMGILSNNAVIEGGSIIYQGEDLLKVGEDEYHRIRGHKIGMIFQDPLSSLNPIMKIGKQIIETTMINANQLKSMYNNLINSELTAYKNAKVIKNQAIIQSGLNEKDKDIKLDEKLAAFKADKTATPESIKQLETENNKLKQMYKQETADVAAKSTAFFKNRIPILKKALKDRKKSAKAEVKAYKNKLTAERDANLKDIYQKMDACTDKKVYHGYREQVDKIRYDYKNLIKITHKEAKRRALEVMEEVGIPQPERRFKQYPFEFSGGMRQRIVIAIALTATPDILICDEPTTALDVTIQAQILELINNLKKERELSCIFITHDLGVVANMADRVAVMYAGKIVEYGRVNEIFFDPRHPYTWAMLSSIPDIDSKEKLEAIPGTPPNMIYPPKGDAFALRSKYAMAIDFKYQPPSFKVSETHFASTWLLAPNAPKPEMPKIVSTRIKKALEQEEEKNEQR
jgi:oligopeptide transport system ATP-binding protein